MAICPICANSWGPFGGIFVCPRCKKLHPICEVCQVKIGQTFGLVQNGQLEIRSLCAGCAPPGLHPVGKFLTIAGSIEIVEQVSPAPVPDFFEPILAWRCWAVKNNTLEPLTGNILRRLHSVVSGPVGPEWPYKARAEAVCRGNAHLHDAPALRCHCGFYGFKSPVPLLEQLAHHPDVLSSRRHVIGLVKLWGRMVEHLSGWRAQYAYPALLCTGGKSVKFRQFSPEELGRRYEVEIFDGTVMDLVEKAMS